MNYVLERKKEGLSSLALRFIGFILLCAGAVGKAVFENVLVGDSALETSPSMSYATAAILLQGVACAAVPIYAFFLMQGFENTRNIKKYFLRLASLALASEIPYDLTMSGSLFDKGGQNPVFALCISLVMLYFFRRYGEKRAVKAVVFVAALAWSILLSVDYGVPVILLCAVFRAFRKKDALRPFAAAVTLSLCTVFSPLYIFAPLSLIFIHYHNGEKGIDNKAVNYLSYPVMLLIVGITSMLLQ